MFGHFYNQGMRKMAVRTSVKFLITYKLKEQGTDSTIQSIRVLCNMPKEKVFGKIRPTT